MDYLQGVDGEGTLVGHGTRRPVLQQLLGRLLVRLLVRLQHSDFPPPEGDRKVWMNSLGTDNVTKRRGY